MNVGPCISRPSQIPINERSTDKVAYIAPAAASIQYRAAQEPSLLKILKFIINRRPNG
jgi:hypothetical protein